MHGATLPLSALSKIANIFGGLHALASDEWTDEELRKLVASAQGVCFHHEQAVDTAFAAKVAQYERE